MNNRRLAPRLVLFLTLLVLAAFPRFADGGTVTVFNTNDSLAGSLRQAIQDASPGDTIVFQIPATASGYIASRGEFYIRLTSAELTINKDLAIDGAGQKIVIQRDAAAATPFRIFNVLAGKVAILNLTVSGGNTQGTGQRGAGLQNAGVLTMRNCTVRENLGSNVGGGGLYNAGTLRVETCTFFGNNDGTSGFGSGGGIHNDGTCTVSDSTFSGNRAVVGGGITSNGSTTIRNTIVVGNTNGSTAKDVLGPFVSEGYNLIGEATNASGFGSTGDQVGASPAQANLGLLQDNSGWTATMQPLSGSLAIDQGKRGSDGNGMPINNDQRGAPRPVDLSGVNNSVGGDGSDIGAVEMGPKQLGPGLTVTSTAENGGECTTDDCTLLEAMNSANANPDANTITFAPGVAGVIRNTNAPGGLTITNPLTINGPGARTLAISGANIGRVFRVMAGTTATITGLTIRDASTLGSSFISGGGIWNAGTLTLQDCAVLHNTGGSGAGAFNDAGTLHVINCTFDDNASVGHGAALRNTGNLTVTNSTIANNLGSLSGGITSFANSGPPVSTTLTNCTVSGNRATDPSTGEVGGLLNGNLSTTTVRNTLVAFNTGPSTESQEVRGTFVSGGHNFIRLAGIADGFNPGQKNDQVAITPGPGLDPKLDTLKNNGGPTDTFALLSGSTAINAGNDANAPATDQRGYYRSGVSDIGAFEFAGAAPVPPSVITSGATNIGSTSATLNGSVNPNGITTTFQFTSSFGTFEVQNAGNGTAQVPFSVEVNGLSPNTEYRFNTVATSAAGTARGVEQTFTTLPPPATPTPTPTRFANISTRLRVETGDNVLIGGFIVTGSMQKRIIIRALGPSLPVDDRLANPLLELYDSNAQLIDSNDNWQEAPNRQEIVDSTIPPSNELESAILRNVDLGAYTAVVRDVADGEGVGLVEVYDLGSAQDSKLANIATRGRVLTGDNVMIGGLIVTGSSPQKVIVRAIGPSLGISGQLEDPLLELFDGNGNPLGANNNWKDTQQSEIEATTIPPSSDLEAAIVTFLPPAAYTAIVRGVNESTGVALVEVYALN